MNPKTHRLLVSAYILFQGAFLLLHRRNPPLIWAPPGGRLLPDESPVEGILREVREEAGIEVEVLGPAGIWYGDLGRGSAVSIDFVCRANSDKVQLSDEHHEFCWSTLDELRRGKPDLGGSPVSYRIEDFEKAFEAFGLWAGRSGPR